MNIIYKIKKKIKEYYLNECSKIYLDIHVFNNLKKYIIIILVLYIINLEKIMMLPFLTYLVHFNMYINKNF